MSYIYTFRPINPIFSHQGNRMLLFQVKEYNAKTERVQHGKYSDIFYVSVVCDKQILQNVQNICNLIGQEEYNIGCTVFCFNNCTVWLNNNNKKTKQNKKQNNTGFSW